MNSYVGIEGARKMQSSNGRTPKQITSVCGVGGCNQRYTAVGCLQNSIGIQLASNLIADDRLRAKASYGDLNSNRTGIAG